MKRIEGMSGYRWEVMLMSPTMTPGDLGIIVIDGTKGALVVMAAYGHMSNVNSLYNSDAFISVGIFFARHSHACATERT